MYTIRRFSVVKTATVVAVMYVVIVAVFFIPFAILALAVAPSNSSGAGGLVGVIVFALLAALLYGVFGWIFTAIACAIYNLAAGWVGGIEVQVDQVAPPPAQQLWAPSAPPPAPPAP
jgi:hypothetical protein